MTATFTGLFNLREGSRRPEHAVQPGTVADLSDRHLVVHPDADPTFVEQHRRLGAALHQAQLQDGTRSVLVASAASGDGKTLSATNIALTLSQSFRKRVLLVDGDLRKPAVHALLGLQNGIGLSDMLRLPDECFRPQTLSPTLSVVTGGTYDADPVALLVSDAADSFFAQARSLFDWIVVDTPPVVLFPDAGLIAGRVDDGVAGGRIGSHGDRRRPHPWRCAESGRAVRDRRGIRLRPLRVSATRG
jgi:Mrp family chromosome partitioning ATPase